MNDLLPAPPQRHVPPTAHKAMKASVMATIAQESISKAPRRASRDSKAASWRGKRAFVGVAAVLALLLAVPIFLAGNGGAPSASAREILTRAAKAAAVQPPISVGDDQYLRRKTMTLHRIRQGGLPLLVTLTRQTYSSASGDGLITEQLVSVDFESPEDEAAWVESGREIRFWGNFSILGPGGESSMCHQGDMQMEDLDSLPSDPDALDQFLTDKVIQGDIAEAPEAMQTWTMFEEITTDLSYPGSPAQRAALFEVLARQPGIEELGSMTDHLGRVGTGIGATWMGVRSEMIIDTSIGQVLEFRAVRVDPKDSLQGGQLGTPAPGVGVNSDGVDEPGTLLGWGTQERLDVVDSLPNETGICAGYPQ